MRYGCFVEIPPSACLHVPLHGDTAGALASALQQLVSSPGLRRTIGNAAARHAAANLSVEGRARQYVEAARTGLAIRTLRYKGCVSTPRNGAHWTTKLRAVKN